MASNRVVLSAVTAAVGGTIAIYLYFSLNSPVGSGLVLSFIALVLVVVQIQQAERREGSGHPSVEDQERARGTNNRNSPPDLVAGDPHLSMDYLLLPVRNAGGSGATSCRGRVEAEGHGGAQLPLMWVTRDPRPAEKLDIPSGASETLVLLKLVSDDPLSRTGLAGAVSMELAPHPTSQPAAWMRDSQIHEVIHDGTWKGELKLSAMNGEAKKYHCVVDLDPSRIKLLLQDLATQGSRTYELQLPTLVRPEPSRRRPTPEHAELLRKNVLERLRRLSLNPPWTFDGLEESPRGIGILSEEGSLASSPRVQSIESLWNWNKAKEHLRAYAAETETTSATSLLDAIEGAMAESRNDAGLRDEVLSSIRTEARKAICARFGQLVPIVEDGPGPGTRQGFLVRDLSYQLESDLHEGHLRGEVGVNANHDRFRAYYKGNLIVDLPSSWNFGKDAIQEVLQIIVQGSTPREAAAQRDASHRRRDQAMTTIRDRAKEVSEQIEGTQSIKGSCELCRPSRE